LLLRVIGVVQQFVSNVVKRVIERAFRNNSNLLFCKAHFVAKYSVVDSFDEED
jgi:2-phosphoglycerate kinase